MLLGGVKVRAPRWREETSSGRRRLGHFGKLAGWKNCKRNNNKCICMVMLLGPGDTSSRAFFFFFVHDSYFVSIHVTRQTLKVNPKIKSVSNSK